MRLARPLARSIFAATTSSALAHAHWTDRLARVRTRAKATSNNGDQSRAPARIQLDLAARHDGVCRALATSDAPHDPVAQLHGARAGNVALVGNRFPHKPGIVLAIVGDLIDLPIRASVHDFAAEAVDVVAGVQQHTLAVEALLALAGVLVERSPVGVDSEGGGQQRPHGWFEKLHLHSGLYRNEDSGRLVVVGRLSRWQRDERAGLRDWAACVLSCSRSEDKRDLLDAVSPPRRVQGRIHTSPSIGGGSAPSRSLRQGDLVHARHALSFGKERHGTEYQRVLTTRRQEPCLHSTESREGRLASSTATSQLLIVIGRAGSERYLGLR